MRTEGLDWFAFTIPEKEKGVFDHVRSFLEARGDSLEFIGQSRWYRNRSVYKGGAVLLEQPTSRNALPYMVELPGAAFTAHGGSLQDLCVEVAPWVNVNRVDWRIDFFSLYSDFERVFWAEEFHGLRGQEVRAESGEGGNGCRYTGIRSGKDEFVLRYYDKKEEQNGKTPFESCQEWWRLEWVVRKVLCKSQPWFKVARIEDIRGIMAGCLYKRFKVPVNLTGGVESLPRMRYHSDLPSRYARLKARAERDQLKIAEMEEEFGCGALKEF